MSNKAMSHQAFLGTVKSILSEEEYDELDSLSERALKAHQKLKDAGETDTDRAKKMQHQITFLKSFNAFDFT